jgi:hypothetical protein
VTPATTYTVTAKDAANQSTTRDLKLTVADTPLDFTVAPGSIAPGGAAILGWNASKVPGIFSQVSITAVPADASLPASFALSGTANVSPSATTSYTLTAKVAGGGADVKRPLGLTVGNAPVALVSFDATPTQTTYGGSSTLSWSYTGIPLNLTVNGTSVLGQTNLVVTPSRRQTYVLSGSNPLNTAPSTLSRTVAARGLDLLAGNVGGTGMRDGSSTAAQFNNPMGMAFDANGNLFIADYGNFTIRKATPAGLVTTFAGQAGVKGLTDNANPLLATLNGPRAVDIDKFGNMIVADGGSSNTGKLRLIQPSGAVLTVTGADNFVKQPWDFGIDATASSATAIVGWVVDYTQRSVTKLSIDPATAIATVQPGMGTLGITASPAWSTTSGLSVDGNGILYVADSGNQCVRAVKGTTVTIIAGVAGTSGAPTVTNPALACLKNPYWVATSTSGTTTTLYIADKGNNAIRRVQVDTSGANPVATGTIDLLAGSSTGTVIGGTDGPGATATFAGPQGLALYNGSLYITDSGNAVMTGVYSNIVRKMDTAFPAANVTTFLGTSRANTTGSTDGKGAAASFKNPMGLAKDSLGNLYVADSGNGSLRKVTADGTVSTTVATGLINPTYVAVDSSDNVYFVEKAATTTSSNLKVLRKSDNTVQAVVLSGGTLTQSVGGLAISGGNAYLVDGTTVKQVVLGSGALTTSAFAVGASTGAVAVDAAGVIYVADNTNYVIKSAASMSTPTASMTIIGGTSTASGFDPTHIKAITGFAFGSDPVSGHALLYLAENGNNAIRVIDLTIPGTVNTVVGRGVGGFSSFFGNLPGRLLTNDNLEGSIYKPIGIVTTAQGDLIVTTNDGLMQITAP